VLILTEYNELNANSALCALLPVSLILFLGFHDIFPLSCPWIFSLPFSGLRRYNIPPE